MSEPLALSPPLPSFDGATEWINSAPLGPADLRGRVVVVNFWTLTCINWLRQEPYVRGWHQAYRDDGLVVVGVHTPEFSFEHNLDRVREAVKERGIDYPVAVDNHYAVWRAFENHFWPALYFAGRDGRIRDFHVGEERYAESEQTIQELLRVRRAPLTVAGTGVEAAADWDDLRTPETYLGDGRGAHFASPGGASAGENGYEFPRFLEFNHWALDGRWGIEQERVVLVRAGGSIAYRYQARDVHLVMSAGDGAPIPFQIFVDGEEPGDAHGLDVDGAGNGVLREGRLYQLIREPGPVPERTLEITFLAPGAEAYAFTFG